MSLLGKKKKATHAGSRKSSGRDYNRNSRDIKDELYDQYYEGDEAYYEDDAYEGDEEYYEEEVYEDEEYYEEEAYEDEEYYEEEGYEGDKEYYEEEAYEDEEYYEEESYEGDEEYYEEDMRDYSDDPGTDYAGEYDDEPYEDDDYEEGFEYGDDYDDDDYDESVYAARRAAMRARRKRTGLAGVIDKIVAMPTVDKIIALTGVAVLLVAVITGVVFATVKQEDSAVAAFAEVGTQLEGVTMIGEAGLHAVANAQANRITVSEEMSEVAQQVVETKGASVTMKMTSIVKDLKIKFVNAETEKLIANVPFTVEVTTPGKKTETWTDDDKDGVIYKENIEAGGYKIKMLPLEGDEYKDYIIASAEQTTDVKATIAYQKVDVVEEIKTEAEVNAAVEDTAVAEVVEESKLTDTVPFYKSTTTAGEVSYKGISKSEIKDPGASARLNVERLGLAAGLAKVDDIKIKVGESATLPDKINYTYEETISGNEGSEKTKEVDVTWTSSDSSVAELSGSKVTGKKEGTAKLTGTTSEGNVTINVTVEAAPEAATLTIDPTEKSLAKGAEATLKITTNQNDISWVSSDTNRVTVTPASDKKSAVIKGVAVTEKDKPVTITVTAGTLKAVCKVTVTEDAVLALTADKLTVAVGKTGTFEVKEVKPDNTTFTVETSDKNIATATISGKKITVTGVKAGTAKITVKGNNGKEAACTVTVGNLAELDTTSLLKDKNGNQVYVKENGNYRKAVYADYYKFNEFFLQTTETLYTGWQTLNGKTYYYLDNHKPVTGEQVIQGAKYVFASDGSLQTSSGNFGIDVSKWNGNINWSAVKSAGVSYAIIRCGYRGSTTGALITDPTFAANISGANAAGIKTGVYFFTQAINEKEAVEEASMVLSLVKKYKISYPIFLDVESSGGRADGLDKATRTAVIKAFCATIQNSGYTAGVYANKTWLNSKMDAGSLGNYKIWLAQYAAAPTYTGRYNLWQYSSKGSIPGIKGNVDLNLSYLGY